MGKAKGNHYIHGLSHTRIDNIYKSMVARCYNQNSISYPLYGARGICVCNEWLTDRVKFYKWALDNGYSDSLTIDRINPDGNYEPSNCRWVTFKEQNNNRRNNRYIQCNGENHTLGEWSEITGLSLGCIWARLKRGWTEEEALLLPLGSKRVN